MKRRIIKAGVLILIFVAALVISSLVINRGTDDEIVDMGAPTLPRISFMVNENDEIIFAGEPVPYFRYEYYMLNKPAGVITATEDRYQKTVLDFFGERRRKDLSPVGRLDKDTVGLLLVTNDGGFHHRLLSPKKHIDKEYYARIDGRVDEADREKFEKGIYVDEIFTALPAKLMIDGYRENALESDFMDLANSRAPKSALENGVSEIRVVCRKGNFIRLSVCFMHFGKGDHLLKADSYRFYCP